MKKFLLLNFLCFIGIFSAKIFAQVSEGGLPPSFYYDLKTPDIDKKVVYPENLSAVFQEDAAYEKMGVVYRYGVAVPVNADMENSGTWTTLPDGRRIWRLVISSPDAKAIGLNFNKFWLPEGSKLFVYNESRDYVVGAYTHSNNTADMIFAIQLVKGETIVLEYVAPEYNVAGYLNKRNATEKERNKLLTKPVISISHICYAYRNVGFLTGDEKDSSCEVNINCSPEGTNWQNQKKGVARISVYESGSYGWCSGSLVNNAAGDCTPYFLTADHCGGTATAAEFNQWVFYFNYEATTCSGTTGPTTQTVSGATLKARGPFSGGSDFLLLQLNTAVPANYNAYYNGWNNGTAASTGGVCIHHPAGIIKKISTYTSTLTTSTYSGCASNSHWVVYWAATTNGHGVTEGGSSGSPLFDNNKHIVGTLTGGTSYCATPDDPDMYGKFCQHWISNGTANNRQLKPWLDPSNTHTTLDGTSTCGTATGLNCTNAINLTCGQTYSGTTVGGASNVTTYSCQTWSESGPEKVHKITTTATGTLTATLSNLGSNDLDVFILSSCNENACVASGDLTASYANAPAGTYYIVVDGYSGASGTYTLNVTCNGSTASCDTITNVGSSENLTYYTLTSQWGYIPGHNGLQVTSYADKYTNTGTKYIKYAWVPVAKAYASTGSSSVTFKAWNGSGTTPGSSLGSQAFTISSFTVNAWKLITFSSPIPVSGNFFFGFDLNYSNTDTFAVYTAENRTSGTNTAYLYVGGAWSDFTTYFSSNLNTSLGLEPVLCTTAGINENGEMENKILMFPNPANDKIVVDFGYFNTKIEEIVVYDVIGKIKEHIDVNSITNGQTIINLDNYNAGLYFISVKTNNKTVVNKFTVIK